MTRQACAHCQRPYYRPDDIDPHDPDYELCQDCADLSVFGAACSYCDRIPGGATNAASPCRNDR